MNADQLKAQQVQDDELRRLGKSLWYYTDVKNPEDWELRRAMPPLSARLRYCQAQARAEEREGSPAFAKVWSDQAEHIQEQIDLHGRQHGPNCVG